MRASSWNQISIFCPGHAWRGSQPGGRGSFFKSLHRFGVLRVVLRSRGELAEPHGAQFPAERLPAHRHPELIPQPLRQIDQPPAHDPVEIGLRAGLDCRGQGRALLRVQERPSPGGLPVDKTPSTVSV